MKHAKKTENKIEKNYADTKEENRLAYNCEPCKGLGLQDEHTLCSMCDGTGKYY